MFNKEISNGVLTATDLTVRARHVYRQVTKNQIEAALAGLSLPGFDGASIMEDRSRGGNCYTAFPVFNGEGPRLCQINEYILKVRQRFDQMSLFKADVKLHDNTFEDESPRYVVLIEIL